MTAPTVDREDADAVTELVRGTRGFVWQLCARLVDPMSADDLTQDTYVRAMRSLHTFRGTSSAMTWLATIARRVCADEIARRQRARLVGARLAERHGSGSTGDDTGLIDLVDVVDRLVPDRREAFVRTAVAGLSYAETAARCGCPVGTIRSRVARARSDLVEALSA
jgi:RNA polymerase sigma-70 factor (ECF subfamily)